jgi:hypothetical protein
VSHFAQDDEELGKAVEEQKKQNTGILPLGSLRSLRGRMTPVRGGLELCPLAEEVVVDAGQG